MKKVEASQTLSRLLKEKVGFRNDDWRGGGRKTFSLREVLYGELVDLRNSDMLRYCNERYDAGFDLGEDNEALFDAEMTEEERGEASEEFFIENAPEYVSDMIQFLFDHFGTDDLHALWLTGSDEAADLYGSGGKIISGYRIPDDHLVVSDLNDHGALFVFRHSPASLLSSRFPVCHPQSN